MQTFLKIIKAIGVTVWVLILIIFHLGIAASCDDHDSFIGFTSIVLILIWWILTVGIYLIYDKIDTALYGGSGKYYKKPISKKSALAVRAVLYVLWLLILVFFHLGIPVADNFLPWIIAIAIWWAATIITHVVTSRRSKKKEAAAKAEYEAKYVSEFEYEDEMLGKMKFIADSKFNELESTELHLPPFGADSPNRVTVCDYKESDRERIFQALRDVYAHKEEIIEHILPEFLETLTEYEETDDNGKPYTLEKLREVMTVIDVSVLNDDERFMVGLELSTVGENTCELGGHGFIANINFIDKTIDYDLPG